MQDTWFYLIAIVFPLVPATLLYGLFRYARAYPQKFRKIVILGANLTVLFFALSLLFLGLETYYRFWYDTTDSFGLARTTRRWMEKYYRNNRMGVRDNVEYQLKRVAGKPRLTFIGDSFTAGHGIKDVEKRFVNLIRKCKPEWEVHTISGNGLDTRKELEVLQQIIGFGYELDIVVLVYCLNDIADLAPEWNLILNRIYKDYQNESFLLKHSYCVNTLYYRYRSLQDPDVADYYQFVRQHYESNVWRQQQQQLFLFKNIVEQHGGRLVVVTFPFLHALGNQYEYQAVHVRLQNFWRQLNVPHLDLLPLYRQFKPSKLTVNSYDAHPNSHAHSLAAKHISAFIDHYLKKE